MNQHNLHDQRNRRRAVRLLQPGGSALCRASSSRLRYQVHDASKSGVALRGPNLQVGTSVTLDLWWPRIGRASAHGIVCRQGRSELAVHYSRVSGMTDLVYNLSAIKRLKRDEALPLLCGQTSEVSHAIDLLDAGGFAYKHVRSPLEALAVLQDPWNPIAKVVVSPSLQWLEFSLFLQREYPDLCRLLLTRSDSPTNARRAIDNLIVDDALTEPYHPNGLYAALGLAVSEEECLSCARRLTQQVSLFCNTCVARSSGLDERDDLGRGC